MASGFRKVERDKYETRLFHCKVFPCASTHAEISTHANTRTLSNLGANASACASAECTRKHK